MSAPRLLNNLAQLPDLMSIQPETLFVSANIVLQIVKLTETPAVVRLHERFQEQNVEEETFLVPEVNVSIAEGMHELV